MAVEAYRELGVQRGELPVTEATGERILSPSMFSTLSETQQDRVVDAVVRSIQRTTAQPASAASA